MPSFQQKYSFSVKSVKNKTIIGRFILISVEKDCAFKFYFWYISQWTKKTLIKLTFTQQRMIEKGKPSHLISTWFKWDTPALREVRDSFPNFWDGVEEEPQQKLYKVSLVYAIE